MGETDARKRKIERRSERILEASLQLFCERGIEETSIEDIAEAAGAGAATVYRYFTTKAELAVRSAVFYWEKISERYIRCLKSKSYSEKNGKGQMEQILGLFEELFEQEFSFWKFLYEFDAFIMKYRISWDRLQEYETCILNLKPYMTSALEKGVQDGSLCFSCSVDEVYFTLTHLILSLMQKLAVGGRLLPSDERVALSRQVKIAADLLLRGLSAEEGKESKTGGK